MSKILAIDYGTKKMGFAISKDNFAFPDDVVRFKNFEESLNLVKSKIHNEKITEIVVGIPFEMDNSETRMTKLAKKFIENLEKMLDLEVVGWNEIATSAFAYESSKNAKFLRKKIDNQAARIILQEYLDYKNEG